MIYHRSIQFTNGKSLDLVVSAASTVGHIKDKIKEKQNIPVEQQDLRFGAEKLTDDTKTISDLDIRQDSVLRCAIRLQGG